ncbi:pyridoxamine 5'-phosphate oxidase family protein [Mucilaginibacter sp. SJ]|uniref:pyridoxamine 5'-phosphate oxidase family protein n=1 Tax=Mucilaginibacter sp. SJ TaxID=3029053 RepID=UPI0023A9A076|nr:pyridoxamine 5'-phosphate oxidase family protein [Mucilaginibacter sp. SJ]WEA01486.1 pyridoxamine 5'-phosphate oxidase family protein [Mucilaginibacter sp. SJ]
MLGKLEQPEIEALLSRQVTGRLGCYAQGTTYIVPVNYVYKNGVIYAHSGPGKKIEMMRKNPKVCFEVDDIKNIFSWKSVIAWGTFEEITDIAEQEQTMQALIHRVMPLVEHATDHPSHGITANEYDIGDKIDLIVYKIRIDKVTGRFEHH